MTLDDAFFRQLADQSGFGMIVTDVDGRIRYANRRRQEASGYSAEELIGETPRIFHSGLTAAITFQEMWTAILAGRSWKGEVFNRRKSGDIVRESLFIQPLDDGQGRLLGFSAIIDEAFSLWEGTGEHPRTAIFDALTGLPSMPSMMERLGALLRGFQPVSRGFALLSVDLDGFVRLTESLGRRVTDQILVEVAERIHRAVRHDDAVGRVEGDEFIVVLPGNHVDPLASAETASRLLAEISAPMTVAGHAFVLTASIGIARYPLDGVDAEHLLANAALAMLAAKGEGGNRYRYYDPAMGDQALDTLTLPLELRRDIEHQELVLLYQPKVSLHDGEIVGFEALVRWNHPQKGLIPPPRFIGVAEETGLIVPLSEWVLRAALNQLKAWHAAGWQRLQLSINLSVRNLYQIDLPGLMAQLLAETGVEPRHVELELGESAMMRDATRSILMVDRLRALGVQLSLDGFGTGYSSLAHLTRFDVDRLKIDRLFIEDVATNPTNASIVSAMIAMAHKLGKKTVAMGVEDEAQLRFLRRQECDEVQGYLFSPPCSADEAAAMMRDGKRLRLSAPEAHLPALLLVDDEPNVLSALRRLLRRENYRVLTAASGAEALEILAREPVWVVISDERMPGMSGIELMSRVRSLYPNTIRIILSGYTELATVTDAINRGAVWKYLTKPWDDEALKETIRQAFFQLAPPD
ncbi:hypothetical protein DLREEDagrD3_08090 [Denitratisoma sp. agr-D3]